MSDETTPYGTSAAEPTPGYAAPGATTSTQDAGTETQERVAFCQDCGKPLTRATVRTVPSGPNAGVFCEPCLGSRMAAPYVPVPPYGAPGTPYAGQAGPVTGVSHPVLAALLAFIPGVGAMYNGQYAKGFVHLIIFAVLVSLKDGINDVFGLLVAGWVFYMVFDAYQTARAFRDGLPLPNPFHLNEVGERFGFGKNPAPYWSSASAPASATVPPAGYEPVTPTTAAGAASYPAWTGYVSPTPAGSAPPPAPGQGWASTPVPPVYTGTTAGYAGGYAPPSAFQASPLQPGSGMPLAPLPQDLAHQSRIPGAALWLIGLGVIILLANVLPNFHIDGRWTLPVILAALSVFVFTRNYRRHALLVCALRWPVILMVLAILFALQAAHIAELGRTWPVIIIAVGGVMILERILGNTATVLPGYPGPAPVDGPAASSVVPRATWSDPAHTELALHHDSPHYDSTTDSTDTTKGGL